MTEFYTSSYSHREARELVHLLREYSTSLESIVDQLEQIDSEKKAVLAQVVAVFIAVTTLFSQIDRVIEYYNLLLPFVIAIASVLINSMTMALRFFSTSIPKRKTLRREILTQLPKLKRVIEVVTQIEHHGNINQSDRLEITLYLDKAEGVFSRAGRHDSKWKEEI